VKILFYDCETGGLRPHANGITEVAASVYEFADDWSGKECLERFQSYVKPIPGLEYEDEALRVQNVTLEKLEDEGRRIGAVVNDLRDIALRHFGAPKRCAPFAHNASFDKGFLDFQCDRWGISQPFNHCWRCSMQMFRWMQTMGVHDVYLANLDAICQHYGIEIPGELRHTAHGDVEATAEAVRRMMLDMRGTLRQAA
jgi:DNA polymerase-3 subunit epsilon